LTSASTKADNENQGNSTTKERTMKKTVLSLAAALIALGLAACVTSQYSSSNLNYYRGQNVPPEFFKVVSSTPTEITFEIKINFSQDRLYHIVLDGNTPLAEDWVLMVTGRGQAYTAVLKAKPGVEFSAGKPYRLCIGDKNPEEVNVYSNNYRCLVDFDFTL